MAAKVRAKEKVRVRAKEKVRVRAKEKVRVRVRVKERAKVKGCFPQALAMVAVAEIPAIVVSRAQKRSVIV